MLDKSTEQQEQLEKKISELTILLQEKDKALDDTQQKLALQEQMASIGMIAAGIAHEIKNPLNFVNNFSEMTVEMLEELKEEFDKLPSTTEDMREAIHSIISDIATNCKKINEHGKRAESIIKNMLLQSHNSEVTKSPTDINALLEEYLNLAYHGLRAQNNQMNAKLNKNLDKSIGNITVSTQTMGRVFLNLINNALYAANEKAEQADIKALNPPFMPTVTVSTEQDATHYIIKVKDNGNGIPEKIKAKIFEPFFTTKPVGQGTGLGLPICYDIIVKEHQGTLEVNSVAGEFTEFIITLPKDNDKKQ